MAESTTILFDTLEFSKELRNCGFTEEQAEGLAKAQKNALDQMVDAKDLATKKDMMQLEHNLKKDMLQLEHNLKKNILEVKHDMLRWVVMGFITQTGILIALILALR